MEDKDLQFLNSFTEKLSDTLVKQCTADGMLDGKMLMVEELNDKWRTSAPEYMVDAVPQIAGIHRQPLRGLAMWVWVLLCCGTSRGATIRIPRIGIRLCRSLVDLIASTSM